MKFLLNLHLKQGDKLFELLQALYYSNQLCRFLFAQEQGIPKLLALKYVFAMLHCKDLEMYKALAFFIFFENET